MHDETWLIVDTETDGMMAPIHAVKIAARRMRGWRREGNPLQVLLNHEVPIDPGAEADTQLQDSNGGSGVSGFVP